MPPSRHSSTTVSWYGGSRRSSEPRVGDPVRTRSHGYVETADPQYMLTIVDRGADVLAQDGRIGIEAAGALKAEARRRAESDEFFGHIAYVSLIARRAR